MQQPKLWERIVEYEFPRGFEDKLCDLFGYRADKTAKLKQEYRRFVYLAMVSPSEATPSEQIDRVWHLHLSYTRDYWKTFCPHVLQREFHHDPCDGIESRPRYDQQYAATLALYEREFGSVPPFKVWPTTKTLNMVRAGEIIVVCGFVISFFAVLLDGPNKTDFLAAAIILTIGGAVLAVRYSSFGNYAQSFQGGGGGGGGTSGGCGGGGCGGGGG